MDVAAPSLLRHNPDVRVDSVYLGPEAVMVEATVMAPTSDCPRCGHPSDRVHSRYARKVRDLPWQGRSVTVRLTVRKFVCGHPGCGQKVFCERLPGLLAARGRTTERQTQAHRLLGLALGGEAGARLATELAMPTSPDTLLRRVRQSADEPEPAPRVVGIDDWALRKGQRYGTIIIDLERGRVVELLPGRDGVALKAWLQAHPQVRVVSRDRWPPFAQAVAAAVPQAQHVADRWHLLKNLREALERLLSRRLTTLQQALATASPAPGAVPASHPQMQRRLACFQTVCYLHREGVGIKRISRELGLGRKTVQRYLRSGRCPDNRRGVPTLLTPFATELEERLRRGKVNVAALHRELLGRGCQVSLPTVRRFVWAWRAQARVGQAATPPAAVPPLAGPRFSPRQLSFACLRRDPYTSANEQAPWDAICRADAHLAEALDLAETFAAMVRKESTLPLDAWLAKAERSAFPDMRHFAAGLRQDQEAVQAALTEAWSNGPVEGHVNRLKTIKRQMYGRAELPLLRARVLHVA